MADEQLIEGGGKVKRRIHVFVIIIVSVVIGAVVFITETTKQEKKKDEGKTVEVKEKEAPDQVQMAATLEKQKEAYVPGIPGEAAAGVAPTEQESKKMDEDEARAIEEARNEARIAGAALIMESGDKLGSMGLGGNGGDQPAPADANPFAGYMNPANDTAAVQNELRAALADDASRNAPQPARKEQMTKQEKDAEWLESQSQVRTQSAIFEDPRNSPYTIFQGAVIPAVLETKVDSTLPGDIKARVISDVYDGVTGNHLIIPKGSQLYGSYSNNVAQGQNRVMGAFHRIIYPGGRSVSLGGMQAADAVGGYGIPGTVNNKYWDRFGPSFLVAILGGIADRNASSSNTVINTGGESGSNVSSSAGTILVDVAKDYQSQAQSIQPSINLKQGDKFNVMVNRDIAMSPYK